MSLSRLAEDSVTRRLRRDTAHPPLAAGPPGPTPSGSGGDDGGGITGALSAIEKFVPTEIVGIYVAVAAILIPLAGKSETPAAFTVAAAWLATCLVLTPVYYCIAYATRWKRHTGKLPRPADVPRWPVLAASVAFVVWGLAVSQYVSTPLLCGHLDPAACANRLQLVTVLVLVVAPLLGAIDALVNAKKDGSPAPHSEDANGVPLTGTSIAPR
jgi:hypothetical protein